MKKGYHFLIVFSSHSKTLKTVVLSMSSKRFGTGGPDIIFFFSNT